MTNVRPDHTKKLTYSIAEVVTLTGVGRSFLYEEIAAGRLRVKKAGRRTLVPDGYLKAWLEGLPEARAKGQAPNPSAA